MGVPDSQRDVAEWLGRLAGAPARETHISAVFIGANCVWKLKKAVRLPFLDFTACDDRCRFLQRELELNAPAAPGLYRDVAAVVRRGGGLQIGALTPGEAAVDWVLRMAPVPAGDFLDVMADQGRLTAARLDEVADVVAAYHRSAPVVTCNPFKDVRRIALGNAESAIKAGLPGSLVDAWLAAMMAALDQRRDWVADRGQEGFVRRTHGDLHLGNLCLWAGRPVPFDALEFDEAMGTIDLGYDIAFLLMDLELRMGRAAASQVLNRYLARTGDFGLVAGLAPFLSMRAMIRAHVQASRGAPHDAYLRAAQDYLRPGPAAMVAIGGWPGSGKSTLARALAPGLGPAPGAVVLRADECRKRLHGVAPEQRLPEAAYGAAANAAVVETLLRHAQGLASAGHAVIVDTTCQDPALRTALESAAAAAGVPFLGIWLTAPLPELRRRIEARSGDASDATVAVLDEFAARAGGLDTAPGDWHGAWLTVDASFAEAARASAEEALRNRLPA